MTIASDLHEAHARVAELVPQAIAHLRVKLAGDRSTEAFDREQHLAHGISWLATYAETFAALAAHAEQLGGAWTAASTGTSRRSGRSSGVRPTS